MMNKTEEVIMQEIDRKGYANIEHGMIKGRSFGARIVNVRNSLLEKGCVKIIRRSVERDAEHGRGSVLYLSTIEKA
jgi:hypothetical protein